MFNGKPSQLADKIRIIVAEECRCSRVMDHADQPHAVGPQRIVPRGNVTTEEMMRIKLRIADLMLFGEPETAPNDGGRLPVCADAEFARTSSISRCR